MSDSLTTSDTFVPPAKGQAEPVPEPIEPDTVSATATGLSIAKRWAPDLDAIASDINRAIAILPPVTDPPPLVKDFESPVFWTTTVLPIALAVVAYVFHQDLSPLSVSLAAVGAAITTLGYTIYRGIYRHAHSQALTTAAALKVGQVRDAAMLATTGHIAA